MIIPAGNQSQDLVFCRTVSTMRCTVQKVRQPTQLPEHPLLPRRPEQLLKGTDRKAKSRPVPLVAGYLKKIQ